MAFRAMSGLHIGTAVSKLNNSRAGSWDVGVAVDVQGLEFRVCASLNE